MIPAVTGASWMDRLAVGQGGMLKCLMKIKGSSSSKNPQPKLASIFFGVKVHDRTSLITVKLSFELEIVCKFPFLRVLHLTRIPNTEKLIVLAAGGLVRYHTIRWNYIFGHPTLPYI